MRTHAFEDVGSFDLGVTPFDVGDGVAFVEVRSVESEDESQLADVGDGGRVGGHVNCERQRGWYKIPAERTDEREMRTDRVTLLGNESSTRRRKAGGSQPRSQSQASSRSKKETH